MSEKIELFKELQTKVDQMTSHYEDVIEVHFIAKLKNKSKLEFNYDEEVNKRLLKGKTIYKPISTFNSVIDMIAALTTITILILTCVFLLNGTTLQNTFITNALSIWIAFFTFSSVYHLFNRNSYSKNILFLIRQSLLICSILVTALASLTLYDATFISYFVLGIFAAIAIFFTVINTNGSISASNAVLGLMSIFLFSFVDGDKYLLSLSIIILIAAIVPVLANKRKSEQIRKTKTNGIFNLSVVIMFTLVVFQILG